MEVVIRFEEAWLAKTGVEGRKVLRGLEKWARNLDGVKLLRVAGATLSFEMAAARKPSFRDELIAQLKSVHGLAAPEKIFSFGGEKGDAAAGPVAADEVVPSGVATGGRAESAAKEVEAPAAKEGEVSAPDAAETLDKLLNAVPAKYSRELCDVLREFAVVAPMLKQLDAVESFWRQNLLVAIDDGYGLSEFLDALGALFVSVGLAPELGEKSVREMRLDFDANARDPFEVWRDAVECATDMERANTKKPGVRAILCLDIGAWQDRLGSAEVKAALRKLNVHSGNFMLVFRVPFIAGHVFKRVEAELADILNIRPVVVPPVPVGHLTDYAREELAKRAFVLEESAAAPFEQWILEERSDDSFFGYKTLDKMVNRVIYEKALLCAKRGTASRTVGAEDLAAFLHLTATGEANPYEELDKLVGLAEVKQRVREVVALVKASMKSAKRGKKMKRPAIHMLFTGNPGTGKTTVARLVAQILKEEGILRKGHLLEVRGRDLCGEYIGQTAPKTSAICRDAYGSVLFIDEAYSLFRGDAGDRDYGREALDTLIAEMENHRDDMCVILAGYPDEMQTMLSGNAGLESRIPYHVDFPNYTRADLARIFMMMVEGNFDCEEGLDESVTAFFEALPEDALRAKEFSNARFVRNLYERTWGKAAYRSRLDEGDVKLMKSDLAGAAEEREFKQLLVKPEHRAIGFA